MSCSLPEPVDFSVASGRLDFGHRVAPSGELDVATSATLERELLRVEETDAHVIELDLGGLTFIDSAGVRVVAGAQARSTAGSRLRLKPGTTTVERVRRLWVASIESDPSGGRIASRP